MKSRRSGWGVSRGANGGLAGWAACDVTVQAVWSAYLGSRRGWGNGQWAGIQCPGLVGCGVCNARDAASHLVSAQCTRGSFSTSAVASSHRA